MNRNLNLSYGEIAILSDIHGDDFSDALDWIDTNIDHVFTTGDNIEKSLLPNGDFRHYQRQWQEQALTQLIPYNIDPFFCCGNHETDNSRNNGLLAYMLVNRTQAYYKVSFGADIDVYVLNTANTGDSDGNIHDGCLDWLTAQVNNSPATYKICIGHHDINSFVSGDKSLLMASMESNGIDLYIHGHKHQYNKYVKNCVCYLNVPQTGKQYTTITEQTNDDVNDDGDAGTIDHPFEMSGFITVEIVNAELVVKIREIDGIVFDSFVIQ